MITITIDSIQQIAKVGTTKQLDDNNIFNESTGLRNEKECRGIVAFMCFRGSFRHYSANADPMLAR
eukprot:scaffold16212_cov102-Skeletonema_dohrnii-CCMP3373.AAC.2